MYWWGRQSYLFLLIGAETEVVVKKKRPPYLSLLFSLSLDTTLFPSSSIGELLSQQLSTITYCFRCGSLKFSLCLPAIAL